LSYSRFIAGNPIIINHYFDLLEKTLLDNDLIDSPSRIFNCDETALPLDHSPSSVITEKGQKHARTLTAGQKKQITVLACGNAAGYVIPPLVIFARKTLNPELTHHEIPSTMYGLSDNGWMTGEIFENWFTHHFLVHVPAGRPLLLLIDGHSTHYNPNFINKAAHEKIIVFCLPPNSTHLLQPLDKRAFGPLKTFWNQECQAYMSRNPGKVVTRYSFMQVFSQAWCHAMTTPNLISAFKTTGVYPINRHAIDIPSVTPKKSFQPEALGKKTGLDFIPFYSPVTPAKFSCSSQSSSDPMSSDDDFTIEERSRFRKRFTEGYDILTDQRYNLWLQKYCNNRTGTTDLPLSASSTEHLHVPPSASSTDHLPLSASSIATSSNLLLGEGIPPVSVLKKILIPPQPQIAMAASYQKSCGKVLTSAEHQKILEEKERVKNEKLAEKERKRQERERKKEERLEETRRKKEERERKKKEKEMKAQMKERNEQIVEDRESDSNISLEGACLFSFGSDEHTDHESVTNNENVGATGVTRRGTRTTKSVTNNENVGATGVTGRGTRTTKNK
jgi:hypothetical protein